MPVDDHNTVEIDLVCIPDGETFQRGMGIEFNMGGRDYERMQRFPGDYEAQMGQRSIAVHALEHLAVSDRGVTMMRKGDSAGHPGSATGPGPTGAKISFRADRPHLWRGYLAEGRTGGDSGAG